MYFESTNDIREAIARERQIKRWSRAKKIVLIKKMNPRLLDLADGIAETRGAGASSANERFQQ